MTITPTHYRCPLGRPNMQRPDPEDIKRNGWRREGILVISISDDRLDWTEQELLKQIGQKLYGRRQEVNRG
jgi:hypothetical protein